MVHLRYSLSYMGLYIFMKLLCWYWVFKLQHVITGPNRFMKLSLQCLYSS